MARSISQLSPKAQKAYAQSPELAATRAQQVSGSNGSSSSPQAALQSVNFPTSLPGFVKDPLLIVLVLVLGFILYGRFVKPVNFGLTRSGVTGNPPTTQSYIDQQNRKVALVADTMPGRIVRVNPAKVGAV